MNLEQLEDRCLPSTFTVLNTADLGAGSLRDAITRANALEGPDTIDCNLPAGSDTITLSSQLEITDSLTIVGPAASSLTIDGGNAVRLFSISEPVDQEVFVEIRGLTLRGGNAGTGDGGAILNQQVTLTLRESVLTNNQALRGGAIFNATEGADTDGQGPAALLIIDTEVTDNSAADDGGGVYTAGDAVPGGSLLVVSDSVIAGNTALRGGGIFGVDHVVSLGRTSISANRAVEGGGVYIHAVLRGSTLNAENTTFDGNQAVAAAGVSALGGAVHVNDTRGSINAFFLDCTISNNSADGTPLGGDGHGGGLYTTGFTDVINSTFLNNSATAGAGDTPGTGQGGAIWTSAGLRLENSTISGNSADNDGGGLYSGLRAESLSLLLRHGTFTANRADSAGDGDGQGGGIFTNGSGTVALFNTIVAANLRGSSGPDDVNGDLHTLSSGNLIGVATGLTGISHGSNLNQVGTAVPIDPLLGPIGDNGGPTLTHGLRPGSPAIDAGDDDQLAGSDQRGVPRPVDGNQDDQALGDVGAVEFVLSDLPPAFLLQQVAGTQPLIEVPEGTAFQVTVRYTTSDLDRTLSGLGLRLHFDSSALRFEGLSGVLATDLVRQQVLFDLDDFDADPATDTFLLIAWADVAGNWPDQQLPVTLFRTQFALLPSVEAGATSIVRFTASSTAASHGFEGTPIVIQAVPTTLDVDRNGVADALTDGLLIRRYLLEFRDQRLVENAVAADATRTNPAALVAYLDAIRSLILDVDANGVAAEATDGALIQRYLFGFRGDELVEGVVDPAGRRTDPLAIVAFLDPFNPNPILSLPSPVLSGTVFRDSNGNGIRNPGEPGRDGVTVELVDRRTGQVVATQQTHGIDGNGDGTLDPQTEQGRYRFVVVPGEYEVREVRPPNSTQTFPFGSTERVSVDAGGLAGDGISSAPASSGDGRFVAFPSTATNLVPGGDTNGKQDVFVLDRQTGVMQRISNGTAGVQGNGDNFAPALSDDGRFVAFQSNATNLVSGGNTNGVSDVYVFDRQTGAMQRISGAQGNGHSSNPSVSGDGRFVAFESLATNLIPGGDTNGHRDVFVFDRHTGVMQRISNGTAGVQGSGDSFAPALSGDGRFVAFQSTATNLIPGGDTNGHRDVFVFDRQTGLMQRISNGAAGVQGNGDSSGAALSGDGRFVAFESLATNLIPAGDTNGVSDIFVFDRQTGLLQRVSDGAAGGQGDGTSGGPALSGDGRIVAFRSNATNLVPGDDTNNSNDVFVFDRQTGLLQRVSNGTAGGQGNGTSGGAALSGDGRFVAFSSLATNLVPGDDTNGREDVFVHAAFGTHAVTAAAGDRIEGLDFGNFTLPLGIFVLVGEVIEVTQLMQTGSVMVPPGGGVKGTGTVLGNLFNAGQAMPGRSPGVLTVEGDYTQTATGELLIELGGLLPDLEYDQLHVTGVAALDGTLSVELVNGFTPQAGDRFQIMTFGSRSGEFHTITGLDLGNGLVLAPIYELGSLDLVVVNVAPVAAVGGDSNGVRGQPRNFVLSATDSSSADTAAGFTFHVSWGDGASQVVSGRSGVALDHVYTASGTYSVQVTATDREGGVGSTASHVITIQAVEMQDGTLAVGGTLGRDLIRFRPAARRGHATVRINGAAQGNFRPDRILAYGQADNDVIRLDDRQVRRTQVSVTVPAFLFGGDGNDTLDATGSIARNVLQGGAGNDRLIGGRSRDLLTGGQGADKLNGRAGGDILIAGTTAFDANVAALSALMAEWASTRSYAVRVSNLRDTGSDPRLNGDFFLRAAEPDRTVFDDGTRDVLGGRAGRDWFFANFDLGVLDVRLDRVVGEFADDLS